MEQQSPFMENNKRKNKNAENMEMGLQGPHKEEQEFEAIKKNSTRTVDKNRGRLKSVEEWDGFISLLFFSVCYLNLNMELNLVLSSDPL